MSEHDTPFETAERISVRDEWVTYATAFFSLSLLQIYGLVVPLWTLELEATVLLIGIAIGIRSFLPTFLSIHGGVLMDRFGVRRITMLAALITAVSAPLYPLFPSIGFVIFLQLIGGLTTTVCWMGAQTQIGRLARGNPKYTARFSAIGTLGTFVGPVLFGFCWDVLGPAATFNVVGAWTVALVVSIWLLPATKRRPGPTPSRALREVLPRSRDYVAAWRLLLVPAVAFVMAGTFLRLSSIAIQGSFYPVYLKSISLSGTTIGLLMGAIAAVAGPAAFAAGWVCRYVAPAKLMLVAVTLTIVGICATPLFTGIAPLAGLAILAGVGIGLCFPTILTVLAKAVGPGSQGLSVGLRGTVNRVSELVVPVTMGLIAEAVGVVNSFYITGAILIVLVGLAAWYGRRTGVL